MQLPPVSFEFFAPKTPEGHVKLADVRKQLDIAGPDYFSVTYGAGGSSHDGTVQTVHEIHAEGRVVAPHISCIGATKASVRALLDGYQQLGIKKLVALRGDLPSGYGLGGEFRYAADLVSFIRMHYGDAFEVWVAAYPEYHPQARSAQHDLQHFVDKMKAGATGAITQLFYNSDAYFHFVDEVAARGVDVDRHPIMAGVMPIHSFSKISRFAETCGAEIPRWISLKMQGFGDDTAATSAFGTQVVVDLVSQLVSVGCPGLHFYTLNQAGPTLSVLTGLR
jgi:methylenetetrahydrofolate reductase (NADPH)